MSLDECCQAGEKLGTLCGDPGMMEIRKQLEDIHSLADDVHEIARDREDDLKNALGHADKFQELLDVRVHIRVYIWSGDIKWNDFYINFTQRHTHTLCHHAMFNSSIWNIVFKLFHSKGRAFVGIVGI